MVFGAWQRVWTEGGLNDIAEAASSDTAGKPPLFFWCRGQHRKGSTGEALQARAKELLERKARTQPQADAPRIARHNRSDFQKPQADGSHLSTCQLRTEHGLSCSVTSGHIHTCILHQNNTDVLLPRVHSLSSLNSQSPALSRLRGLSTFVLLLILSRRRSRDFSAILRDI
jgi:hypothetical protein